MKQCSLVWLVAILVVALGFGPSASADPAGQAKAAKSKADIAKEREKLLGAIPPTKPGAFESTPNPDGDYVYEAASAGPLVKDLTLLKLEADKPLQGLTTAVISPVMDGNYPLTNMNGLCWRLKGIKEGRYWLGLVYQSGTAWKNTEIWQPSAANLYVNGREVKCSTRSDPVQVAPNVWFVELQAASPEMLKDGAEVEMQAECGNVLRIARLLLHPVEPVRGAGRAQVDPGPAQFTNYPSLGLCVFATFLSAKGQPLNNAQQFQRQEQVTDSDKDILRGPDGRAIARCTLSNPLPVPVEIQYDCTVHGYYMQEVGKDAARLTLAPHSIVTRDIGFTMIPGEPAYSITANVKRLSTPDLGWPEFDELAFFPGYRQQVPWARSFEWDHRRVYFNQQGAQGGREKICLDGQWKIALTSDLHPTMPLPASLKFEDCTVPFLSLDLKAKDPKAHGAYVKRTLVLPEDIKSRLCRIVVEAGRLFYCAGIMHSGTMYLNGQKIGEVRGSGTPLIADATAAARAGENELVIVVQDMFSVMNPAYVRPGDADPTGEYQDAPSFTFYGRNLFLDTTWMELTPRVSAEAVKVETSVRKKSIAASFTLANRTQGQVKTHVKVTVVDAGKPLFTLAEQDVALDAGQSKPLQFAKDWADPRLWGWREPNLYVLNVEVTDSSGGKQLDLARERFGFRECWIDGNRIMFNGHPVNLKGASGNQLFYVNCDGQVERTAAIPDYLDETGYLATDIATGLCGSNSAFNVSNDKFWQSATENVRLALPRRWNHPSIIAWELSNEWFSYAGSAGADMKLCGKRFMGLSDAARKLDPTRWTLFSGDGDLGGLLDNYAGHYTMPAQPIEGPQYLPDCLFFRPLDRGFLPDDEFKLYPDLHYKYGSKVFLNHENCWIVGWHQTPGPCKFAGEEAALSPATGASFGGCAPWLWMMKQDADGLRDMGMSMHIYHNCGQGLMSRAYLLQTFIMPDVIHHGFGGQKFQRQYSLLNDLFRPAKLTFTWALAAPDGKIVAQGKDAKDIAAGGRQDGSVEFNLPQVSQRTKYTLRLRLESEDRFVCGEERDFEVWPDAPIPADELTRKVALYDPKGATAKALTAAGVKFETLASLAAPQGQADQWALVVGEGALDAAGAAQAETLGKFVEDGGRLVFLAQTVMPKGLPVLTILDNRIISSQPFVRMPTHPVLDGVTSWDLHFWAPNRVSARGAFDKPEGGAAIPLVDSGDSLGLEWTQMMELYRGKGLYLLCQLPLAANYGDEPMAREMLARVLKYAGGRDTFRTPEQRLRLVAAPNGTVQQRLRDVGVAFDAAAPDAALPPGSVTMLEAGVAPDAARQAAWKSNLADGATLVVTQARPEDAKWLGALIDKPVSVTVEPYPTWEGHGYRTTFDPLTAGLSQLDIYWKRYDGSETGHYQIWDPEAVIEPLQDWSVAVKDARELVFPGALVEVKVGKGRLIIDQRRWTTDSPDLLPRAKRNVSALALGLNVAVAPVEPERQLPQDIAYRPVDLTPYANRALADDVSGDGKGGWTDQGPDADMRALPTGKRDFGGVPFTVGNGPKSVIVLKSRVRPLDADAPADATIRIGYPIEGLYLMHTCAYAGGDRGKVATYQVRYADKTSADIGLVDTENIRDWIRDPEGFHKERGTKTVAAWTGTCKTFPKISVYMMRWVNPHPEKIVTEVCFKIADGNVVPVLIGLTAVVKEDKKAPAPADIAKAKELLAQAQAAIAANKPAEAKALLKRAVALWPEFAAAHQASADLCEKTGNEDERLEVYGQWARSGIKAPLPWNRVGEILEKRKDYKGALEAYTQSLRIEWNQPPIIDAKARMEKLLNQKP